MSTKTLLSFRKTALALACTCALASGHANADTTVEGRVTDVKNTVYFEGARIAIKELNIEQVSERDGSFRFVNVPAGEYTLVITYLGTNPKEYKISVTDNQAFNQMFQIGDDQRAIENVLVFGQLAGQSSALNRQKNAYNVKSVVSADAIGQFPDQNAAEALQRLPGLFIQRDQGEGRFVGIRGIDPNLNNVTINGANVPSPESGVRSVAMDVIPSELIEGLEVSKTVTPDMDADAIGGSIEVKSLSAFDREGRSYSFNIQNSYNDQVSENSPKISGSYTNIFNLDSGNKLGLATALSWYERKFGSHNMETDGGWSEIAVIGATSGEEEEFIGAEEIEQRHYQVTRERLGAAFNLDFQTTSGSEYYMRTLYSEFSDDEFRQRNEYKFDEDDARVLDGFSNVSASFQDAEMDRDTKDRYEEQEILSIVLGGKNAVNDWDFEYSLGHSVSSESEPNRLDVDFKSDDAIAWSYVAGDTPNLTQSANAHDLSNFELDEIVWENNETEDEETSLKLDIAKAFSYGNKNGEFKFGGKYRSREKFNDANAVVYDGDFDDVSGADFAAASPDYSIGNFGPGLSRQGIRSYFSANRGALEIQELASAMDTYGQSYTSEEDIFALYGMVSLDINRWHIVAGLRYEDTDFSTSGSSVTLTIIDEEDPVPAIPAGHFRIEDEDEDGEFVDISRRTVDKSYSHLLPSLNVRFDVNDKLVTRFAYTHTIARPGFADSAAFQIIENDEGDLEAEVGNPDLDPFESTNLDMSIEYYPGDVGILYAGYFYKDIDNFIVSAEVQDNGQWDGYDEVIQSINGGSAKISGLELAWTKTFNMGLLLSANATFSDSDDDLPNQADTVGNLSIGYEKNRINTRLSMTHKSEQFTQFDGDSPVEEDTHTQLDLSFKYNITDAWQVYFNAINITDEAFYAYHGRKNYNYQYETYGSTYELGFTFTSF